MGSGRYAPFDKKTHSPSAVPSATSVSSSTSSSPSDSSLKRKRRTADEIKRHFQCTVPHCTKSYGSESALKMHIKLKHEKNGNVNALSPVTANNNKRTRSLSPRGHPSPSPSSSPVPSSASNSPVSYSPPSTSPPTPKNANTTGALAECLEPISSASTTATATTATGPAQNFGLPYASSSVLATLQHTPKVTIPPTVSNTALASTGLEQTINFPLLKLKMGHWERQSVYFGDLIARVSPSEKRFFWESVNLEGIVRTSIPFDTITRIQFDESSLQVSASQPPTFSLGLVQPGLPASWRLMPDFLLLIGGNCLSHSLTIARGNVGFSSLQELVMADPQLKRALTFAPPSLPSPLLSLSSSPPNIAHSPSPSASSVTAAAVVASLASLPNGLPYGLPNSSPSVTTPTLAQTQAPAQAPTPASSLASALAPPVSVSVSVSVSPVPTSTTSSSSTPITPQPPSTLTPTR